ncbi:hypothetical protein TrVE_jg7499 [Triparma verrucosa]|nr:hypothetical protein TrVE_jg7499 [Triparma verrucosa]
MGSTLFVSAASARCLMKVDPSKPVLEQCGNPTVPSFWVSVFLAFSWILGYIIPPLLSGRKMMTWADVMAIRMSKIEGTQFMLYGTTATIALLLFANTDESGGDANPFLQYLTASFMLTGLPLAILIIFEDIIKPFLFPSSNTSISSENSQELNNNTDSFNVKDTGALGIGGLI